MEEGEYKSTYNSLASVRCKFEKALTNHQAKCHLAKHFCLADREGYSCESTVSSQRCGEILEKLRKNSVFVLKLREVNGPLPHNMELRVQVGGMKGLARLLQKETVGQIKFTENNAPIEDINGVLNKAVAQYGTLDNLPYSEIIKSVMQFQGRKRRQR